MNEDKAEQYTSELLRFANACVHVLPFKVRGVWFFWPPDWSVAQAVDFLCSRQLLSSDEALVILEKAVASLHDRTATQSFAA